LGRSGTVVIWVCGSVPREEKGGAVFAAVNADNDISVRLMQMACRRMHSPRTRAQTLSTSLQRRRRKTAAAAAAIANVQKASFACVCDGVRAVCVEPRRGLVAVVCGAVVLGPRFAIEPSTWAIEPRYTMFLAGLCDRGNRG
jgi:hypothetical protein